MESIANDIYGQIVNVKKEYHALKKRKEYLDGAVSDILHIYELAALNAAQLRQVTISMIDTLIERREISDRIEELKPLYTLFCNYDQLEKDLKQTHNKIKIINYNLQQKSYSAKSRQDLIDKFSKKDDNLITSNNLPLLLS